jgi:hypothetical protein
LAGLLKATEQVDLKFKQLYRLLGRKSQLSLENKVLVYKVAIKPIRPYASNYGVAPTTPVLPSYKDANERYSDQWLMRHGTYQIARFIEISASHSSKMFYKKEAPNITTVYRLG